VGARRSRFGYMGTRTFKEGNMETMAVAQASIDMTGKTITTYIVYHAAVKLREMNEGEVLEIVTDGFTAIESDIKAWCRMSGQALVLQL
jgi:hypothetical protein